MFKIDWYETLAVHANKKISLNINKYTRVTPVTNRRVYNFGRLNWRHVLLHDLVWIYMSLNKKAAYDDHWSQVHGTPIIYNVIGRDLWWHIHSLICPYDPLLSASDVEDFRKNEKDNGWKVRFFLERFNEASCHFMFLDQKLAFDDIMKRCYNKSRVGRRLAHSGKPNPVGLRFWGVSNRYGYCFCLKLDCNHTQQQCEQYRAIIDYAGPAVVMYLCHYLKVFQNDFIGLQLFIDNWFHHPLLDLYLISRGVYATGTYKDKSLNLPENYETRNDIALQKGESQTFRGVIDPTADISDDIIKNQAASNCLYVVATNDTKIFCLGTTNPLGINRTVSTRTAQIVESKNEDKLEQYLNQKESEYYDKTVYTRARIKDLVRERNINIGLSQITYKLIDALLEYDKNEYIENINNMQHMDPTDTNINVSNSYSNATNNSDDIAVTTNNSNNSNNSNQSNSSNNININSAKPIWPLPSPITLKHLKSLFGVLLLLVIKMF